MISMFDVRRPDHAAFEIRMPSLQPVHSLWTCPPPPTSDLSETIFAVTAQGVYALHGNDASTLPSHILSMADSLSTARLYRNNTNATPQSPSLEFLTTARGNSARIGQYSLELKDDLNLMTPRLMRNYRGHSNRTIMTKPCFFERSNGSFIAAADEGSNTVRSLAHISYNNDGDNFLFDATGNECLGSDMG